MSNTVKGKTSDNHGIGLINVKSVVDKYGGNIEFVCDEHEFKVVVMI